MIEVTGALLFDADGTSRADILARARAHLIAKGVDPFDADDMLADRQGLVVRAWWGGEDVGFVQEHHDGRPVIVVNIPIREG